LYPKQIEILVVRKIFYTLIFSITIFSAYAQTAAYKEKFSDADYYFLFEEYGKALKLFQELYTKDQKNANINYLIGLCYIQSIKDKEKVQAIPYLEYATQFINPKYKEGKYKETQAPVYSLYYLAFAYRLDKKFEKAIECYKKYISYLKPKDKEVADALKEIESCEYAIQLTKAPVNLESVNKNEFVDSLKAKEIAEKGNTNEVTADQIQDLSFIKASVTESCPLISNDGQLMIFAMGPNNVFPSDVAFSEIDNMHYKTDDIYSATKDANGKWNSPVKIMSQLKPKSQIIPVSLSYDKKELYLVQDDNDNGNIYVSTFDNDKWSPIKKLNSNINSKEWESHASISADGKTLFFSSARKGGQGGLDIYKSKKDDKGEWGKAENLGLIINTSYDEETPVILEDNKTLFFSSKGHKGMGGFDIFTATMGSEGKWSAPMNVGYSINTVNNDFAYINKVDNQYAYAPLNRTDLRNEYSGKEDENNSYKLNLNPTIPNSPLFKINGFVVFKPGSKPAPEKFFLAVVDSVKKDTIILTKDNLTGEYSFQASSGNYHLYYKADGYKPYTKSLVLPEISTPVELSINVEMLPESEKSQDLAHVDVIFDYEKKLEKKESKKVKIDPVAIKHRSDSIILVAENREKQKQADEERKKQELLAQNEKNKIEENKLKDSKNNKDDKKLEAERKKQEEADKKKLLAEEKKSDAERKKQEEADKKKLLAEEKKSDAERKKQEEADKKKLLAEENNKSAEQKKLEAERKKQENADKKKLLAEEKKKADDEKKLEAERRRIELVEKKKQEEADRKKQLAENKNKTDNGKKDTKESKDMGHVTVNSILFDFNQTTPKDFKENLNTLAKYLINNKTCKLIVEGHTDAKGSDKINQMFSERRANYVKNYLIQKGVRSTTIIATGKGSTAPIAADSPETGSEYNRRVDFEASNDLCSNITFKPIAIPEHAKIGSSTSISGTISITGILFDFEYVKPASNEVVEKLAAYMVKNPDCQIEIIGHSDAQGEAAFKEQISKMRAEKVKKMLIEKGVNSNNIKTKGMGDSNPIAINTYLYSRKYNRRVEFKVLKEGTQKLIVAPLEVPEEFKLK